MNKIIFIRHAQSTYNSTRVPDRDCHITEYGKSTCKNLNFDVNICICSTLIRTKETLDNSLIKYKKLITTELCREREFDGIHEETNEEFHNRVREFKKMLLELVQFGNTICVISHGTFLLALTGNIFANCQYLISDLNDL